MATRDSTAPDVALSCAEALPDALAGMAWFNGLTQGERAHWLERAGSSCPADAWGAYQAESREFAREADFLTACHRLELLKSLKAAAAARRVRVSAAAISQALEL